MTSDGAGVVVGRGRIDQRTAGDAGRRHRSRHRDAAENLPGDAAERGIECRHIVGGIFLPRTAGNGHRIQRVIGGRVGGGIHAGAQADDIGLDAFLGQRLDRRDGVDQRLVIGIADIECTRSLAGRHIAAVVVDAVVGVSGHAVKRRIHAIALPRCTAQGRPSIALQVHGRQPIRDQDDVLPRTRCGQLAQHITRPLHQPSQWRLIGKRLAFRRAAARLRRERGLEFCKRR
ncbi:hypothetical protein GALL_452230 [mine drainage metagenome]|uniref:Uncharacterized protein n=1 Tax=mine drainage metagenome TaxID=410659 RepID=A0A1J5PNJ1_9ZZZZ